MPYKYYFGKTGRVWNVTRRSVGVELLKTVGNRKRTKRIHVRIEHARHSKCRSKFLARVKSNEAQKVAVRNDKKGGSSNFQNLKRVPEGPKNGYILKKRACKHVKPMW